jgi:hypothetical protein
MLPSDENLNVKLIRRKIRLSRGYAGLQERGLVVLEVVRYAESERIKAAEG